MVENCIKSVGINQEKQKKGGGKNHRLSPARLQSLCSVTTYRVNCSFIFSYLTLPIPFTWDNSSSDLKEPLAVR